MNVVVTGKTVLFYTTFFVGTNVQLCQIFNYLFILHKGSDNIKLWEIILFYRCKQYYLTCSKIILFTDINQDDDKNKNEEMHSHSAINY